MLNHKRGAHSAFETIPGGALASALVWLWSLPPYPPMPLEVASTLIVVGGALSSYYIGRTK